MAEEKCGGGESYTRNMKKSDQTNSFQASYRNGAGWEEK
jgi:hypothetical protein